LAGSALLAPAAWDEQFNLVMANRQGHPPDDVKAIRDELERVLNQEMPNGRKVGDAKFGVYAFFDYDNEPIYVGQTSERLRTRIRRHLTNQRTDAVAMSVLDPFEVAAIELWPFWDLEKMPGDFCGTLNSAEYTVFKNLIEKSEFHAVLNEVPIPEAPPIALPPSIRAVIVPVTVYHRRKHSDIRIARRAETIARLSKTISERAVQPGLRNTLLTQAKRLQHLASKRLSEVGGPAKPGEPAETDDEK
jgi:hypothetical protein